MSLDIQLRTTVDYRNDYDEEEYLKIYHIFQLWDPDNHPIYTMSSIPLSTTKNELGSIPNTPVQKSKRSKNRIRKRPVSFGNPALGTYHGFVYTLEDDNPPDYARPFAGKAGESSQQHQLQYPLVEGAVSVRRLVAMVDVPPEQVPEGILNLARSHRQWIDHVRIVIGEKNATTYTSPTVSVKNGNVAKAFSPNSRRKVKLLRNELDQYNSVHKTSSSNESMYALPLSHVVSEAESAASILANEQKREKCDFQTDLIDKGDEDGETESSGGDSDKDDDNSDSHSESACEVEPPRQLENDSRFEQINQDRTYVALIELCSEDAASQFVVDLHRQPYTILDETDVCSVYHVVALQGEDGVSLTSPFFASSTTKLASKGSSVANLNKSASIVESCGDDNKNNLPGNAMYQNDDHYNCAVCLDRIDLDHRSASTDIDASVHSESRTISILTTVCNHSFHLDCLLQWQDSPCPVCRYDHSGLNEALSQCHICGTTDNNYVCLICGVVSCGAGVLGSTATVTGRSRHDDCATSADIESQASKSATQLASRGSHARQHYDETLHAYALNTETQHVWDFAGQGYVHRLLQNKEDGKLVEINDPNNTTSQERTLSPGLSDAQEGEVVHRKLEGFATQYYTLLKSQLEQQRIFYEGRLEEIRREFGIKDNRQSKKKNSAATYVNGTKPMKKETVDLISALKQERNQLRNRLESLTSKLDKTKENVAFLTNMNESLEGNILPLKQQFEQVQRERAEQRELFERTIITPLEEKVTKLMLQLENSYSSPAVPSKIETTTNVMSKNELDDNDSKLPAV